MFQVGIDEDGTNTGLPLQCAILCDIVRMEIKSTIKDESCLLGYFIQYQSMGNVQCLVPDIGYCDTNTDELKCI